MLTPHLGASTEEAQDRVALGDRRAGRRLPDARARSATPSTCRRCRARPPRSSRRTSTLARKLGKLLGQLEPIDVRELRVICAGEAGEFGVRPVANAALAGYLERFLEEPVNPISAPYEAKERGIHVIEVREEAPRRYTSSVRVTISGESGPAHRDRHDRRVGPSRCWSASTATSSTPRSKAA